MTAIPEELIAIIETKKHVMSKMDITVKYITGQTKVYDNFEASDYIIRLKERIQFTEGTPIDFQQMIYQNKKLDDMATFQDVGITPSSIDKTIYVCYKLGRYNKN
uniref:Ubiquitin-like protein n=1 Tax=Clandestinovirus TaxID=2831644 RepID=A0A8F8KLA6_9VIRU|nr:ubiquitin-like protein [Clandestinovirus]